MDVFAPQPQVSTPPAEQPASTPIGTPAPAPSAPPAESPDGADAPSMEDDLRQRFSEIKDEDGDLAEVPSTREPRERGPDGKFLPKTGAAAPGAPAPGAGSLPPAGAAQAPTIDLTVPPQALTAKAKAEWAAAPEAIRAEFYKREADFHSGLGQYREQAEVAKVLWNEIQPYQGIIRAAGADVPTALRTVLNAAATLHAGTPQQKAALVVGILRDHQIDLTPYLQSANAPQQEYYIDPQLQTLQQQVAQQQQMLHGILSGQQQAEQHANAQHFAAARSVIDQFAADPKNLYFSNVSHLMLPLLASQTASSLQEAYDMACRAHPEVFAALQTEARQREQQARAAEAARARRAGGQSVHPAPTPGTPNTANADIYEDLHARYRELTS